MINLTTKRQTGRGFTLLEVLLVIAILGILLSMVLVAINPARQFDSAYDTKRKSDVTAILNAIHAYASENGGNLPAGITSTATEIKSSGGLNLCSTLVPNFIADIPIDPETGTESPADSLCDTGGATYGSRYSVKTAGGNRITVASLDSATISVTR